MANTLSTLRNKDKVEGREHFMRCMYGVDHLTYEVMDKRGLELWITPSRQIFSTMKEQDIVKLVHF